MQHRGFISSASRHAEPPSSTAFDVEEQALNDAVDEDTDSFSEIMTHQQAGTGPASYRQFLEEIGNKYKFASPQLWLGNNVVESIS
jgi:hypothetical protein